jgi:hypothetical protein
MGQCISSKASTSQEVPTISRKEEYIMRIQAILRGQITRQKVNFKENKGVGMANRLVFTLTSENSKVKVFLFRRKLRKGSAHISATPTPQYSTIRKNMKE